MNHTGKIARLPRPLRDELNRRLEQNVPGRVLAAWLNSLPEVQAILTTHFHGDPINQQNLSNWRRGGFAEWRARQDFLDGLRHLAEDAADIEATLGSLSSLTDHVARLLALHFSQLLCPPAVVRGHQPSPAETPHGFASPGTSNSAIKLLCDITRAISSLRRDDLAAARFKQASAQDHPRARKSEEKSVQPTSVSANANEPVPLNAATWQAFTPPLSPEPEIKVHQAKSTPHENAPSPRHDSLFSTGGFLGSGSPGSNSLSRPPSLHHPAACGNRNSARHE